MTRELALKRMKAFQCDDDPENAHVDADDLLCELLRELGYGDIVDEYEKVQPKWYA